MTKQCQHSNYQPNNIKIKTPKKDGKAMPTL